MTDAQRAYEDWKDAQLVSMMVYTDEQMFGLGYDTAQEVVQELSSIILALEKEAKKLRAEIKKLKIK